jgi:hypothetical protein
MWFGVKLFHFDFHFVHLSHLVMYSLGVVSLRTLGTFLITFQVRSHWSWNLTYLLVVLSA